jgi:regulator of sigma E protease
MITLLALIVVLGVLIFVHELGHFVAAKWAGIYVHRFSLGLGAPIPWLTFRRGETEYAVSWLPLGGYVKMASRDEDVGSSSLEGGKPEFEVPFERTFEAKPLWKRMIVILAGVTMNALFAWGVYTFLAAKNGRQLDPVTTVGRVDTTMITPGAEALARIRPGERITSVNGRPVDSWNGIQDGILNGSETVVTIGLAGGEQIALSIHPDALEGRLKAARALEPYRSAVVGMVVEGQPAAKAGIQAGDSIVALAGRPVGQWYDVVEGLRGKAGRDVPLEVVRGGQRLALSVQPYVDSVEVPGAGGKKQRMDRIGIGLRAPDIRVERLGFGQAVVEGFNGMVRASTQIVRTVRGLFGGRISSREVGGPILIGKLAGESARLGLDTFLDFMALISVNLAVLNLLPIPVLDGGQFMFLLAEGVIRRPLPMKLRERLTTVGLVLLVLLMGLAFSNDFRRLFGG